MLLEMEQVLPAAAQEQWDRYLAAEETGLRSEILECLRDFLEAVSQVEPVIKASWARQIARGYIETDRASELRYPLFAEVIFPVLAADVAAKTPGAAKFLASFPAQFQRVDTTRLPEDLQSYGQLLRECVRQDPDDAPARAALIERTCDYLQYTLHELPTGVLYGQNGASVEECGDLLLLLQEFRGDVDALGVAEKYSGVIADCEYHYNAYRDYLQGSSRGAGYSKFLEDRQS